MDSNSSSKPPIENFHLDILGQQPALNTIYTHLCLCFSVNDPSSYPAIVDDLQQGLEKLTSSFPWLAGQVVQEDAADRSTGVFKVKPFQSSPQLITKDLRGLPGMPTMNELRVARFPFSMLDEKVLGPRETLTGVVPETLPVLLLQANFIEGGLLLDVLGEHGMMDIAGQNQIVHLLSKACCHEPFSSTELSFGNSPRENTIPLLDDSYIPGPELDHQIIKPRQDAPVVEADSERSGELSDASPCTWSYFSFTPDSLQDIKALATSTIEASTQYITTNDSVCAFIWQAVMRARSPRLRPGLETTFARAVNARRYLDIPKEYPGLVQNMAYTTYTIENMLRDETLGSVASRLRAAVDLETSDMAFRTRALATFLQRSPDKNGISLTATLDLSTNILLSSWANIDCHNKTFGDKLGTPEAVRLPAFLPIESMFYLLPESSSNGGGLLAGLCLRQDDLLRLREDKTWIACAEFIG